MTKSQMLLNVAEERNEIHFLYALTRIAAEKDSVSDKFSDPLRKPSYSIADFERKRIEVPAHGNYLSEIGLPQYELYLKHIGSPLY